jgi:hypothetical protein
MYIATETETKEDENLCELSTLSAAAGYAPTSSCRPTPLTSQASTAAGGAALMHLKLRSKKRFKFPPLFSVRVLYGGLNDVFLCLASQF